MSELTGKIIRESAKVLILASAISTAGGIGTESIRAQLLSIAPLLILLPALNDLGGDFGSVVSSKFTTMLYMGRIRGQWWKSRPLHRLFAMVIILAPLYAVYTAVLASGLAALRGYPMTLELFYHVAGIATISVVSLVFVVFSVSVAGGLYIFRHDMDPNNFLIPITTSVSDLGNMLVFAMLVRHFFGVG